MELTSAKIMVDLREKTRTTPSMRVEERRRANGAVGCSMLWQRAWICALEAKVLETLDSPRVAATHTLASGPFQWKMENGC